METDFRNWSHICFMAIGVPQSVPLKEKIPLYRIWNIYKECTQDI
jgi:hypothetical protein